MTTFKAYASRALGASGLDPQGRSKRWSRHGGTRYLWTPAQVRTATRFVLLDQGEAMETFNEVDAGDNRDEEE